MPLLSYELLAGIMSRKTMFIWKSKVTQLMDVSTVDYDREGYTGYISVQGCQAHLNIPLRLQISLLQH